MKSVLRASRIGRVLLRYRLDDLLEGTPVERWLRLARPFVPRASAEIAAQPRGARLRLALQELGPIFVKFGQILSTRRDLIPPDIAEELTLLQDRVAPFDGERARARVEQELARDIRDAFETFDTTPLASASIAQVHAATLPGGREVVVKVLRPDIGSQIAGDIALLESIAAIVERAHPNADKIRPREIVAEIENTLAAELDLQREAGNASLLRRNWAGSPDLYVPEVIWSHTAQGAMTMERVRGIPSDDIAALDAAGIDRKALAAKGVRVFYQQVFRDNFFHADAHAGNIWVDPERKTDPRFIALDFGIMGQLSRDDQYWLAENFMAIFNRDYRRIAELHVQAGWMPAHIRIDELEAAARAVCEPYLHRKPALRPCPRKLHVRPAAEPHPRLRQRRRVSILDPDLCTPPAPRRILHGTVGQNAFRRAGSAARLRGAADDRHLPGRFRLDPGLSQTRRAHRLVVSQSRLGHRRRRRRDHQPDGV